MNPERRRYFRINDSVGLRYTMLKSKGEDYANGMDILDLISSQDELIESLLARVDEESPAVAQLVRALNQKLERVVAQMVVDNRLLDRLAKRVKEVSLSACGVGFFHDEHVPVGAHLAMELELNSDNATISTKGYVVAVEPLETGYFWRVDFFDMPEAHQERLIQHVVQRQSAQLKYRAPRE